jgi:transposase
MHFWKRLEKVTVFSVKIELSKKSKIIVEEIDTKQASLFSFLNMEKYLPS